MNSKSTTIMCDKSTDTFGLMSRLNIAILDGDMKQVMWLCENEDVECNANSIYLAAKKGNVKILKYLREKFY